jgi:hypothetical protein
MGGVFTEAKTPFTVVGFSISGAVVDHTGQGLVGVQVLVGGKPSATTDSTGRYVLNKLQEGSMDLAAELEGRTFGAVVGVQVTPSSTGLPPLQLQEVSLCGKVGMMDTSFSSSRSITVTNQATGKKEQVRGGTEGCLSIQTAIHTSVIYMGTTLPGLLLSVPYSS